MEPTYVNMGLFKACSIQYKCHSCFSQPSYLPAASVMLIFRFGTFKKKTTFLTPVCLYIFVFTHGVQTMSGWPGWDFLTCDLQQEIISIKLILIMEMLHFIKTCAAWICNACAFLFFLFDSSIVTVRCRLQRNAQVSCIHFSPFKGNGMRSRGGGCWQAVTSLLFSNPDSADQATLFV